MSTGEIVTSNPAELRAEMLRRRLQGRGQGGGRQAIAPADRSGRLPLSFGQQQMWFLNRLDPDGTEYLVPMVLRLRGQLDVAAFARAWNTVVGRHEVLRTRYAMAGDEPVQVIDPAADREVPLTDLASVPEDERWGRAFALAEREAATGFDLEHEWPARVRLVRLAGDDHLLVMAFHHIACDAWSTGLLADELSAAYRAFAAGLQPSLEPLPVQYADFAAWERDRMSGQTLERHLGYWRDRLAGLNPLEPPTDRPRSAVRDRAGALVTFDFPAGLAEGVRDMAARHGVTPFVVLLTGFQLLLARYTGTTDVAVGTAVSGRERPELQRLIGYGINSLVLRARWDGDPTFAELLAHGRTMTLDAFDHQDVPFARLVDELQPDRDLSRTPLFQVVFDLVEPRAALFDLPGIEVTAVEATARTARFDLTLQIEAGADGGMSGRLEYATALFDAETARRLTGHLVRLLENVVADPDARASTVDLLPAAERDGLLAAGAGPEPAVPPRPVHQVIAGWAARTPDAVAVTTRESETSFAELDARADLFARRLRSLGVGTETLVGVLLDRGPDMVACLLGIWRAGGAYVPLDPSYPADRLGYILGDTGARLVVTETRHESLLDGIHSGDRLLVDRGGLDDAVDEAPVLPATDPDTLAYVIYTSGSTGRPKGVLVPHRGLAGYLDWTIGAYASAGSGGAPLFSSIAFDLGVPDLYTPLMVGQPVHLLPQEFEITELGELLTERAPYSFVKVTPGHLALLTEQLDAERLAGLAGLAIAAGDAFTARLADRWRELAGPDGTRLAAEYGPTEITVGNSGLEVTGGTRAELVSIGHPIPATTMYVLDALMQPVPAGVVGEIYIGGAGVTRGYVNRPDLTAERYVPDPFGPPGARLYRTGDLGRATAAGDVEFAGRVDDQVKIRGYRIEPGEIRSVLARHPGLRDAVVVADDDGAEGGARLVAYCVPAVGDLPSHADLDAYCGAALPDYMVPAAYVPIGAIPLTANGKVDRAALPAPDRAALGSGREFVAPRTPAEERVAAIWAGALGVDGVGVHDGFFDLGGDSIRAVALAGAMKEAGFAVTVRDIFDHRTVAALCEALDLSGDATESTGPVAGVAPFEQISDADRAVLPDGVVDAYPLSRVQLGMIVEMLSGDGTNKYHNVTSFRIRDDAPFDMDAFRRAVALVVERHEVLRTSFDLESYSEPLQLVHAGAQMPLGMADLRGRDEEEQRRALHDYTARNRAELFDLGAPPLLRLFAYVCDNDVWWLSTTECHPILEGWSHHTLLMELMDAYRRLRDGAEPEPLVHPPVRYADFIAAEQEALRSDEDRAYWSGIVRDHAKFVWPQGWGEGPDADREGYVVPVMFYDLVDDLRALASQTQVSLKSVLLSAHLKVLSTLTAEESFFTGLVCNARPEVTGADRVYGMYLNTLPLAHERGARTWRDLLRQVFAREVELWPHRRFPMPEIQRMSGGDRLVETSFSYQDFHQVDTELIDYLASIDESPTEFAFAVSARVGYLILSCNTPNLTRENADRLASMYRAVLESMAADPEGDAQAVYLPEGERELVVSGWNRTSAVVPSVSVRELFEQQVCRSPAAEAVVWAGGALSFAELDARANRFARHLQAQGVGPESAVGVQLDRGPDLVAVLLGVWKAGAAYVPIDPSYPVDRVASMLSDAGAGLSVTSVDWEALLGLDDGPLDVAVDPESLAYVIFTSGSTGRPKGVQVTHRGLVNHVRWAADELASRGTGGGALFSSVAFDLPVPNLWAPLICGQPVRIFPQDLDLADLGAALVEAGPFSFIKLTPGQLDVVVERLVNVGGLADVLLVAGEPFTRRTLERVRGLGFTGPVVNEYGPTEATVGTCTFPVPQDAGWDVVPIGRPLPNMTMYVLDAGMRPVPVGVVGELYVGGVGVARGYAGRPELTADRFVPDPFAGQGARLYRTGDLVRRAADGNVEFVGRVDDQVKIRGYRVEPGEVRTVLVGHEAVRDAAVVADGERLVGYYVAEQDVPGLSEFCGQRLPEYMVPAVFVRLEQIPLNANGKLDRSALPDFDGTETDRFTVPRTVTEAQIAEVWAQVLGLERVGVHDGFFDIGGHSIRAVALVGALRAAGFDVAVRDVFEYRTVAALSEFLTGRPARPEVERAVAPFEQISAADRAALPDGVVDAYPMSQVQLGMLVEMLADNGLHAYHNVSSFRIRDDAPLSEASFRRAVAVMAERHEMLRTSFDLDTFSTPMQLVHASTEIGVSAHDLRGLDTQAELREFVAAERARLFELDESSLLRMAVHQESDEAWWLTVTVCHAITEGWSHRSMLMELLDVYRRIRDGAEPEPAEPPSVRYADFIAAERRSIASDEDRGYWRGILDRHARLTLPEAWAGDTGAPREKYRAGVPLRELETGLRGLAARSRTSLKTVLLAAHLKVLSMVTGEESFITGLVCSARPEALGADRVYGMYLNTLPFAHERGARTWRELVERTFAREVEVWPRRRFPMPEIQRLAGGKRLVDVRFSYQDFHQVDTEVVDVESSQGEGATEFALAVAAVSGYLVLTTDTHALSRENADRLVAMYRAVLESMAADPEGDAQAVYLPEGERELVVSGWNRTSAVVPSVSVRELFEQQVCRSPAVEAVVWAGGALSFAELDARANRFARHLQAQGVGPESAVGVQLDRGPDLVAVLLGVWKAGAAYVPIDPSYPVDRVASMLSDAGAGLSVTSVDWEALLGLDDGPLDVAVDPESLAYVIFTSGSTGRPKGVQVTHRGLVNHVRWAADELASRGTGGGALFSSVAFDLPVPNLWAPLICGQPVRIFPQDLDLADLGPALAEAGPFSFIKLTPGHLRVLAQQLNTEQAGRLADVVLVAGEAFAGEAAGDAAEILGPGRLINEYGPTEATVGTCTFPINGRGEWDVVPIGSPLPNMTMYVLDAGMRPVPVGVVGELYVGGVGVARGYAGRPELTADRFVPDPFAEPGARLYRTGDLVRRAADGNVEFIGRVDDQVKIRGYRVEPGEIRTVLAGHDAVQDVAVTTFRPTPDNTLLVAYYVAATTVDGLTEYCSERLPEYMVPAAFVRLEEIPLNANGKLDRSALPDPDRSAMAAGQAFVAPRTKTERILADIWSRVLNVAQVGVHDKFLDLGGHSILMIQVLAAARRAGLTVSVWRMYQHETLEDLAAAIDQDAPAQEPMPDPAPEVPLTPLQRMLLGRSPAQGSEHTHEAHIAMGHAVDPEILDRALRAVVGHHDALRLRVNAEAGTARVAPVEEAMGHAALSAEADRDRIVLRVDPVLADETSVAILAADLESAVRALSAGKAPELPAAESFAEWARRLAGLAADEEIEAQAHLWLNRAPAAPLPLGDARTDERGTVEVELPPDLTAALPGDGATQVLLAALGLVLTRWTGGDRVLIDLEDDGRSGIGRAVGLFGHRHPVQLWLPSKREPASVLRSVRGQLDAIPDRGIGYGLLRLDPDDDVAAELAGLPEPQVGLRHVTGAGRPVHGAPPSKGARPRPLEVDACVRAGRLRVRWTYPAGDLDEVAVTRLAVEHLTRVAELVERPAATAPAPRRRATTEPIPGLLTTMKDEHVPGVSIAVLRDGEPAELHAHGVLAMGGTDPVTPDTLFQAGSISKHVTALGALTLVEQGRLDLDEDVNRYLTSWQVPGSEDGAPPPVITVRHLLGNTSGLSLAPNKGYRRDEPVPSLLDLLCGRPPVTTPPVRAAGTPGAVYRKANVNWSVLQQVMEDVTGLPFTELMDTLVLGPLGMDASSYHQRFPETSGRSVAVGHAPDGSPIEGGWRVRLEVAAAGLWTTAEDLTKIAREIRRAHRGEESVLIGTERAHQMLVPHPGAFYGLGSIVDDTGADLEFGHGGEPIGYWNMSISRVGGGTGFVALTNGESGGAVVRLLVATLGRRDGDFGRGRLADEWRAGHTAAAPADPADPA
ncbi:non-ribosomal peptide synthetase [Actinomadura macra]|uniref:non-ribosomal peptide synthetase n=1 Tax=Actinomadura macra TaxID=46164 RepID=UPI00082D2B52|nr:non-ribosomal peptide synthetase [Actinomadura macra]